MNPEEANEKARMANIRFYEDLTEDGQHNLELKFRSYLMDINFLNLE